MSDRSKERLTCAAAAATEADDDVPSGAHNSVQWPPKTRNRTSRANESTFCERTIRYGGSSNGLNVGVPLERART